jgi:hypothetical protein
MEWPLAGVCLRNRRGGPHFRRLGIAPLPESIPIEVPADLSAAADQRGAEARRHTRIEIPFYTGRRKQIPELVAALA